MKLLTDIFAFRSTENIAALGSATLSTAFSPTWWLLNSFLNPYIKLDELTTDPISLENLPQITVQTYEKLQSLGNEVLLGQVLPILIFCLAISLSYLFITGWLGQKAVRMIISHLRSEPA